MSATQKYEIGQRVRFQDFFDPPADSRGIGEIKTVVIGPNGDHEYCLHRRRYDDGMLEQFPGWYAESQLSPIPEPPTQEPSNS